MKKSNGVTMIVLIISIAVLLILAVVLINAFTGEEGILQQAEDAAVIQSLSEFEKAIREEVMVLEQKYIRQGDYSKEATVEDLVKEGILRKVEVSTVVANGGTLHDKTMYIFAKGKIKDFKTKYGAGTVPTTQANTNDFKDAFGVNSDFSVYYYSQKNKLYGELKFE